MSFTFCLSVSLFVKSFVVVCGVKFVLVWICGEGVLVRVLLGAKD